MILTQVWTVAIVWDIFIQYIFNTYFQNLHLFWISFYLLLLHNDDFVLENGKLF